MTNYDSTNISDTSNFETTQLIFNILNKYGINGSQYLVY